jgi:arginine decarboxylase
MHMLWRQGSVMTPVEALEGVSEWGVERSKALYNCSGWGAPYFSINEEGHVVVRPKGALHGMWGGMQGAWARPSHGGMGAWVHGGAAVLGFTCAVFLCCSLGRMGAYVRAGQKAGDPACCSGGTHLHSITPVHAMLPDCSGPAN